MSTSKSTLKANTLANIATIAAAAAKAGADGFARLRVSYAGDGDSGGIESVAVEDVNCHEHYAMGAILQAQCEITVESWCYTADSKGKYGQQRKVTVKTMSVEKAAEQIVFDLVDLTGHDGFENNDGGRGEAVIDLVAGKLESYEHTNYYMESDTTDYEAEELLGTEGDLLGTAGDQAQSTSGVAA